LSLMRSPCLKGSYEYKNPATSARTRGDGGVKRDREGANPVSEVKIAA